MSYKALVKGQVRKAFNDVKDLVVDVTLVRKTDSGFNFTTMDVNLSAPTTTIVKGIVLNKKKEKVGVRMLQEADSTEKLKLILIAEDIVGFTDFDTVTIAGITYTPDRPFETNDFTYEIDIVRRK